MAARRYYNKSRDISLSVPLMQPFFVRKLQCRRFWTISEDHRVNRQSARYRPENMACSAIKDRSIRKSIVNFIRGLKRNRRHYEVWLFRFIILVGEKYYFRIVLLFFVAWV
jgi:hypothetical protein